MQPFRAVAVCLILVLLTGCSAAGGKATSSGSSSSAPAPTQFPPVSTAVFANFYENPALAGDFTNMDENQGPDTEIYGLRALASRIPCMTDYSRRLSGATQAAYMHNANRDAYLIAARFPSNEDAAAVQPDADAMIKCFTREGMGAEYSRTGAVKLGETTYPVYGSVSGDAYRATVFTTRNLTSVVIVRGESQLTINALASALYESIQHWA